MVSLGCIEVYWKKSIQNKILTKFQLGLGPGLYRSYFANGFAMILMAYAQRKISELGLRD